ncbi:uncharacterized protein N7529_006908 [Penicillium soppii]|uniref:uncharacterized protein n=1 Tax=Penicillium soppii TaxID=69789 RepID=UPI002549B7F9|nr:uncharacterized protein N7529_006908 [Penicillium soppii]KAJ5864992.1 hypothetical protein N7529_006908 [Penicillium soppii]
MPPKITIIGGGIGGLALAIGLLRRRIPVQIYEAAPAFTEIGLGLSLGPAAYRAMPRLDPRIASIYDSLVTTHADSPGFEEYAQTWFELVWACGECEGEVLMDLKALPSGQTAVRRADFLNALVALVPPDIVHFGKRCVGIREVGDGDGGVECSFADGEVVLADVVVGCDGIKSRVKEFVVPGLVVGPRYSGMYGYRAVLGMEEMVDAVGEKRARVSTLYMGKGCYAISYPIMRAQMVNVGIYVLSEKWEDKRWVRPAKREDMLRDTEGMGRYVQALVEVCAILKALNVTVLSLPSQHMPDPSQWAIFEHPHIPTYARSRVAIMGDAAHASTPHQGAGAGQAIEDAHVLAELLSNDRVKSAHDVVSALKAFDDIRRPRCQRVVTTSKENADLLCLSFEGVGDDADRLKKTFNERLRWLWDLDVEEQVERAKERMFEYLDAENLLYESEMHSKPVPEH